MTAAENPAPAARRPPLWPMPVLIGSVVFLFYTSTAAPCAWWGDGMELASAAWTLGVPHPTGYPLYMALGYLWMHGLGWLDPGRALTLFSTACLSGSVVLLLFIFLRVLQRHDPASKAWVILAALAIATARTVWEHATFAEVYPLTFLLGAGLILFCWKIQEFVFEKKDAVIIGVISGLLALNHYSGIAYAPLVLLCVIQGARETRDRIVFPILFLASFLIMLGGYAYLPLRAAANPPLNWGDPSNLERLVWTLKGGQFSDVHFSFEVRDIFSGIAGWLDWWKSQWFLRPASIGDSLGLAWFGIIPVIPAVAGLMILIRSRRTLGWGLLLAFLATVAFAAFYHIVDIDAYFLPALPAAGVGWIVFGQWVAEKMRGKVNSAAPLAVAFAIVGLSALTNYPWIDKSDDREPLEWGERVLIAVPENAVVLTFGDHSIFALWYQQIVLERRKDVTVFGTNFIFSGWYGKYFEQEDRPRLPMRIEDRPIPPKIEFDRALLDGTVLPIFREGAPIYATYSDPVIDYYFSPVEEKPLISENYAAWVRERFPHLSLGPTLYRLERNPRLEGMNGTALAWELRSFYARQNDAISPAPQEQVP